MLIGVVGLNGSGKDTVAQYLVQKYDFEYVDLGQEIRDMLKTLGKDHTNRGEMMDLGNEMRTKKGANFWCKRAIESSKAKNLVVTSIRNPSEVAEIKSHGGTLVWIFADQNIRYQRTISGMEKSHREHGEGTLDEFIAKETKELENSDPAKQQLLKCISMAEYKLDNNGSIQDLDREIRLLLDKLKTVMVE